MRESILEPDRLASSLFQSSPYEAYDIALDFLNDALFGQDSQRAVTWSLVLVMIEKMQSDYEGEPDHIPELHSLTMM